MARVVVLLLIVAGMALPLCVGDDAPSQSPGITTQKRAAAGQKKHAHQHDHKHGPGRAAAEPGAAAAADQQGRQPASFPAVLLSVYCLLLVAAALAGGWAPARLNVSHTGMQTIMSFVAGLMLGVAAFHMLPHGLLMLGPGGPDVAARWLVAGLLVMFFLLRLFHFHQHDSHGQPGHAAAPGANQPLANHPHPSQPCPHEHLAHPHQHAPHGLAHPLSWLGVFLGLALHTLIDGFALGASIEADAVHGARGLLGIGTFLAIFLHIPLDTVSISSLMSAGGYRALSRGLATLGFALLCPAGALLFVAGVRQFNAGQPAMLGCALAFSAGVFLCIALSELLPEMAFHSHDRGRLSAALLLGVALAYAIGYFEPAYLHGHNHSETAEEEEH